jgi:periplasmic divalent cation tolerance protein
VVSAVQVQFSLDDRTRGDAIASELLRERLVACVQTVGPITSRYWWNGAIDEAREWTFVCKTTPELSAAVIEFVRSRHPYEIPEIVAFDLSTVDEAYRAWIVAETTGPPSGGGNG